MQSPESLYEYCEADDRLVDYCLWDYPPRAPMAGKFRSYNLLLHSLAATDADPRLLAICRDLRRAMGPGNLVWGVKQADGHLSWEIYIYDYRRLERERSIPRMIEALAPHVGCDLHLPEQRPYFMFSIDLHDRLVQSGEGLQEINVYLGNPGSEVSSGLCYSLTAQGMEFTNLYYFYDARRQMDDAIGKLACSAWLDLPGLDVDAVLWPQLRDCEVIVVANKRNRDGVYCSRIGVDQLLYFLQRMQYPEAIVRHVHDNRARLDHLLFDVGLDYRLRDGRIEIVKSAYYGFF